MSTNLRSYTKAVYTLDAIVRRADSSDWDNQSPCEEWSARQVLGHVIWHTDRLAALCSGGDAPTERPEADVAGSDPVGNWNTAKEAALAALDSEGALQTMSEGPFGPWSVDDALVLSTFDAMTHAWDIAKATGQEAFIPEELAEQAFTMVMGSGDGFRRPGILGPAVEVSEDADIVTRYIALSGRQV